MKDADRVFSVVSLVWLVPSAATPRSAPASASPPHSTSGECDMDGETISGTTVQIGALLSEAAAAADVLVSNTVRDLVAGSGIQFVSRGQANLGARLGECRCSKWRA